MDREEPGRLQSKGLKESDTTGLLTLCVLFMGVKASLEKRFAGFTRLQEGCVLKKDLKTFQKER